jgi:hypothetical protein
MTSPRIEPATFRLVTVHQPTTLSRALSFEGIAYYSNCYFYYCHYYAFVSKFISILILIIVPKLLDRDIHEQVSQCLKVKLSL